jgi:pimeloyl-ACP methyl ester carboxylesterase
MTNQILHYIEQGEGQPLVLVHGFCESKLIWQDFIPILAQKFRVIALDLGGFGESAHLLPEVVTIMTMAEQINDLLVHLNIEKCVLIGHSLGGYVSLAFGDKYPEKLKGLGLFHSTALADSEEKRKVRNNVIEFVEKNGVVPYIENFVAPLFYAGRQQELAKEINFVKSIALKTPAKTLTEVVKAMRDRKARTNVLAKVECPVMFIIGREDTSVVFESYADQIILPWDTSVHIMSFTGHMGMFERPKETLAMTLSFVERCYLKPC